MQLYIFGKNNFIHIPKKNIEILNDEDTFPYPIPYIISDMVHEHVEDAPKVNNVEWDSDLEEMASIHQMILEQLHTIQITNPEYHSELYIPTQFQIGESSQTQPKEGVK